MLPSATTEACPRTERPKRSNTRANLLMAGAMLGAAGIGVGVKTMMDVMPPSESHVVVEPGVGPVPTNEPGHAIIVVAPEQASEPAVVEVHSSLPTTTIPAGH